MKKIMKRLLTGVLTLATVFTALPVTQVHAADSVYTTTDGKAGTIVKIDNGGSEVSSFEESIMNADGQIAYCIDINTNFQSGYKNRINATERMSDDQISDVALNLEYVKQYAEKHSLSSKQQIKGVYVAQITEDGELAALSGSNQYSVSDKIIRGGVRIQKRDLETKDTKPQGGATLKDTAFEIISLNDNAVLVDGKLYNKNETVKTIHTGVDGIATTAADTLPYGHYKISESKSPTGYLTTGAVDREFDIVNDGEIVDLTDEAHSIYNQIIRGDIEGVKIGDGTHKRLANVPFRITSKTTGESHIIVTDANGQFSTLEKGVKYTLKGWEMVKSENAELLVNGKRVENDLTFTATDSQMEVQIEFTFNTSELGSKELVTFEELYDTSNPDEPTKVAEHKDIKDEGQTVTVKEKPESPTTPEEPSTPTKTSNSPKTGDNTPFVALFAMMGISAAGLIFAGYKRFRRVKKSN